MSQLAQAWLILGAAAVLVVAACVVFWRDTLLWRKMKRLEEMAESQRRWPTTPMELQGLRNVTGISLDDDTGRAP